MSVLLDTSVLIRSGGSLDLDPEESWAISAVTAGELESGVLLAPNGVTRAARLRLLSAVLAEAPILPIDRAVATRYGELRAASGRRPTNDLWIAATALAGGLTLITADEQQASLPMVISRLAA